MTAIRSIFTIAAGALAIASCATAEREDNEARQSTELGTIPQEPHRAACSGGRWSCFARVRTDEANHIKSFAGPKGLGPPDLASAYKLDTTKGEGATVAVVIAFDYPNAESDLATYRSQFGLPPCTTASGCFKKVNQDGQPSPLPPKAPRDDDWTVEGALDLDLASAACPKCKLILVVANDNFSDGLFRGQNGAAKLGATVISNSWGAPESGDEAKLEPFFDHPGIGIFAATGDNGFNDGGQGPDYPGTSAKVTGVGGTTLVKSNNARGWTEGAWNQGGSACSNSIPKPSWQAEQTCGHKASSDVSAVGDPNTGVAVYNKEAGGWIVVGGTSAASPFVAGVYAAYGLGAQAPSYAYQNGPQFFDLTTGKNGSCGNVLCNAGPGWDGPTGIGSPNGAALGSTGGGGGGGGGDSCAHAMCSTGAKLTPSCDPCAEKICAADPFCCATQWDSICVGEVASICRQSCASDACAHSICSTGAKLTPSCDSCAGQICAADPFCCKTRWDAQCVSEVSSVCNQSCN